MTALRDSLLAALLALGVRGGVWRAGVGGGAVSEVAFGLRESCGCLVAVTVEDEHLHYIETIAAWQRAIRSGAKTAIERLSIEQARQEIGRTFEAQRVRGKKHWRTAKANSCMSEPTP